MMMLYNSFTINKGATMIKYTEDENGYITIPNNPISKSGVFQYLGRSIDPSLNPDQVYNVWRPEEELNNPETIESFRLTPWIPEHVMLGNGFTPAEAVGVQGVTGETVEFINGTLFSKLKLFGEDLKSLIKAGLKQLSCGFRCSWVIQSGVTPDGQSYDVIQKEIRGNHLASVENARMGSDVRVAMDKAVFALDSIDINLQPNGDKMTLEEIMALTVKQGEAINSLTTAMDSMAQDMKDAKENPFKKELSEEDKKKEEEDKEKGDKKSEAMDSAIAALTEEIKTLKSTAMDGNAVMKAFAAKQALANQVSQIVGAFDHSDLDAQGVAKYGLEKMGIACDSGSELPMMNGILHSRQTPTFTVDRGVAKDSAEVTSNATLDKMGL